MRTRTGYSLAALGVALTLAGCTAPAAQQQTVASAPGPPALDRTVLPIAEPKPPTYTELDARNAKPPRGSKSKQTGTAP
jgi:hypothetical protein